MPLGLRRARSVRLLPESGGGGGLREGGGRGSGLAGRGEAGGDPRRLGGDLGGPARPFGLLARPPAPQEARGAGRAVPGPPRGGSSGRPFRDGRRRSVGTAR